MYGENHIIRAKNNHKQQIIKLIDEIYREYGYFVNPNKYDKDLTDIEKFYRQKDGDFWVYIADNQIIGTIAAKKISGEIFEIKRMYVKKEYRGKGIADKLLQTAIEWGRKHNFKKVILWSDIKFKRAHAFYKKHGFKPGKIRQMFDADVPYKELFFEKKL